jgi:CRP/FNR family transcriptional regulator, dissimilatory nitrate respiration regulator
MLEKLAHSDFQKIELFHGIKPHELEKILTGLVYRVRQYAAGDYVLNRGDKVESLIAVISGELVGEMQMKGMNDLRVEHLISGKIVASSFVFNEKNYLPVDLIARKDSRLIFISQPDLLALFRKEEQVLLNFLKLLSGKGQFLAEKLHFISFNDIRQKLAHYILHQCGDELISFEMSLTQEELAKLFGVARTSVIRVFNALQDEGLIEMDKKWIKCLDKDRLKQL